MRKWRIVRRVAVTGFLVLLGLRIAFSAHAVPHPALTGMQREWIALVLMLGIAILWVTFGTKALVDWNRLRGLPREAVSKAVPLWVGLIGALGLACAAFGVHALFFY